MYFFGCGRYPWMNHAFSYFFWKIAFFALRDTCNLQFMLQWVELKACCEKTSNQMLVIRYTLQHVQRTPFVFLFHSFLSRLYTICDMIGWFTIHNPTPRCSCISVSAARKWRGIVKLHFTFPGHFIWDCRWMQNVQCGNHQWTGRIRIYYVHIYPHDPSSFLLPYHQNENILFKMVRGLGLKKKQQTKFNLRRTIAESMFQ